MTPGCREEEHRRTASRIDIGYARPKNLDKAHPIIGHGQLLKVRPALPKASVQDLLPTPGAHQRLAAVLTPKGFVGGS